jgi:hypothetical protein
MPGRVTGTAIWHDGRASTERARPVHRRTGEDPLTRGRLVRLDAKLTPRPVGGLREQRRSAALSAADVDRAAVLAAAHEVALGLDGIRIGQRVSLFDVPAGRSDLGDIVEETVTVAGDSTEEGCAVMPTWHASTDMDLLEGPTADGFRAAGRLPAG